MKVINIDAFGDLTVDSTVITVDIDTITVDMNTTDQLTTIEIILVPRIKPVDGDILDLYLRREFSDDEYNITPSWSYINSYLKIRFSGGEIPNISGSKYEFILSNNDVNIYRGKLMILGSDESIQDYKTTEVVNKKLKF